MTKLKQTTNVEAGQLNYDHYSMDKYDKDIVNSIPYHQKLHELIIGYLIKNFKGQEKCDVLDLGVGTGITTEIIKKQFPGFKFDVVDFSKKMLLGAKKKLGKENVKYIFGDYSKLKFDKKYDIIVSVIGLHHQNDAGKKLLFKRIYTLLNKGGVFILGDLVTHKDPKIAALNQALHLHHLVNKATDKQTLKEWSYHHLVLNELAPVEDQIKWLEVVGFKKVELRMLEMNTALIICKK